MDYKEYSKNSVDALLDSLLYGGGQGVFAEESEAQIEGTLDPQELHMDSKNSLITFNVEDEAPMQFSLASETAPGASAFSSPEDKTPEKPGTATMKMKKMAPTAPVAKKRTVAMVKAETEMDLESQPGALETGPFVCHYCDASFRMRGYLTRHIKKHAIEKAYKCPFFRADAPPELRCHNSGGFSRRDTYKTHLKARHLSFPAGVRPQDRSRSAGHCTQCGERCSNTESWVECHIESGECGGLPSDYVRTVKSERKSGKLRAIRTSSGHARFISTAKSVIEPKILMNKEALEAIAIVAKGENVSDTASDEGASPRAQDIGDYTPLDEEQAPGQAYAGAEELSIVEAAPTGEFSPGRLYERDFTSTRRYNRLYEREFR
ncbi:Stp1 protein [Maudiozyma humilis]|uniref:Transcription factor STP1 n=1 Tax=Maudiozyma humilis TaxID=51915 RepID=A0AAV5S3G1_MAUHU|nr:Stp1 protein [Kazachstania humilis]